MPWLAASAQAAVIPVSAGADLQTAIDQAQAGDTLRLAAGGYAGKIVINKPLTLEGGDKRDAVIQGDRTGRTITVAAPHVTIKHLTVTKSGISLPNMDAGIFLDKAADAAHIVENNILDNSVGVYLWGAPNALVERNTIIGNKELRENERGNGVTVWNAPNSKVIYNDISHGRDGIFSNASNFNTFSHNHFHDLRYGVHYMYTNDSQIEGNIVSNSKIGYAIMFSTNIKLRDNVVANNRIGVHLSGSPRNEVDGNDFVDNQQQVKYAGTRDLAWGGKKGNFWSNYRGWDRNDDGRGDIPYEANDMVDRLTWRYPGVRLLMASPAVQALRMVGQQFPILRVPSVVEQRPRMNPLAAEWAPWLAKTRNNLYNAPENLRHGR